MKKLATQILLVAVLGLGSGTAALARSPQQPPSPRDTTKYDAWLTQEVHHQLALLPWYSVFDDLSYKVDGTKVTLMGDVTSIHGDLKSEAEKVVKKLEGVEAVDNQINILPPSPMDDQIRMAEFRSIYSFPALESYNVGALHSIHIIVNSGRVTLVGVVRNQTDKDMAYMRANQVPNVFQVTNNLQVENSSGK
jgi:hyperosmotically inducible periplasmic protein